MQTVYNRVKGDKGWRYEIVEEGPGKKTGALKPPFYIRKTGDDGKQHWYNLNAPTFAEAKDTAAKVGVSLQATAQGLTVAESQDLANVNRRPLKIAVEKFIDDTVQAGRSSRTVSQYRRALAEFEDAAREKRVKFLDEITEETLKYHMWTLRERGLAGKTIDTRTTVVAQFMGANNLKPRLKTTHKPIVEEEPPTPYTKEELDALFAAMTDDERIRYRFFLKTGCREQEVQFASWKDIDFGARTYTVRKKADVGFAPKNHESRVIPLRDDLVNELRTYQKQNGDSRWLFPGKQGSPDGHMLRKLKKIALRAGLNCGHCHTTITVGQYNGKKSKEVTCKTHPVCEHFILHRFRKTCATRWESDGMRVRDVQALLGHKNLEITQKYLGVSNQEDLRKRINSGGNDDTRFA
jgi:integrase/recombinase XerD